MDDFTEKVLTILQTYINERHSGNVRAAQVALGLPGEKSVFHRWLKALNGDTVQGRVPRLDSIGAIMVKLGAKALSFKELSDLKPADSASPAPTQTAAQQTARERELEAQVAELLQYKYKWEAVLELNGQRPVTSEQKKINVG